MTISPTQLSLKHLRAEGWPLVQVVEHWNQYAKITQDLFGFVDILAVRPGVTLAVQTTSASNFASRVRKIAGHPNLPAVRAAGWTIHVHAWAKRKGRWVLTQELDMTAEYVPELWDPEPFVVLDVPTGGLL